MYKSDKEIAIKCIDFLLTVGSSDTVVLAKQRDILLSCDESNVKVKKYRNSIHIEISDTWLAIYHDDDVRSSLKDSLFRTVCYREGLFEDIFSMIILEGF